MLPFFLDLLHHLLSRHGGGGLGIFAQKCQQLVLRFREFVLSLPGRCSVEMNHGGTLMLALMDLMSGCDRGQIIMVHELSVGQRGEQLQIERRERGSFLNGPLSGWIVLESQFRATQIQVRSRQMIIERDGLGKFSAGLIILAQTEIGRSERVVR